MDLLNWIRAQNGSPDTSWDTSFSEYDPLDPTSQMPKPKKAGILARLAQGLPGMLQSGIAAAATPNIAYGGPTDIFRAMQAGQQVGQDRDLLNYNINRQRIQDQRQRMLDANNMSSKQLEDAIRWEQLNNTRENTASLIDERKAQQQTRDYQSKLNELSRQLQLGQAGAQQMDEGTPASTEQITPGISLETNAQPPKPINVPYSFKDPFSGKTLVIPQKNGKQEIDPQLGAELHLVPDPEGKYLVTSAELAAAIHNITKPVPPPKVTRAPTPAEIALAAQGVQLPEEIGLNMTREQAAAASEILKPPREPRQVPEATQEKLNAAAALNKIFRENGGDWTKVIQNESKYLNDPVVGPYLDQIHDHAQKQIQLGATAAKANSAVDLLQKRANNASATGGRILQQIQDLQTNYPKLMAGGARSAMAGGIE